MGKKPPLQFLKINIAGMGQGWGYVTYTCRYIPKQPSRVKTRRREKRDRVPVAGCRGPVEGLGGAVFQILDGPGPPCGILFVGNIWVLGRGPLMGAMGNAQTGVVPQNRQVEYKINKK